MSSPFSWDLSSSSDRRALDMVDGAGALAGHGPHYSRRTPGSKTFTGVGQEIVLVTRDGRAKGSGEHRIVLPPKGKP